MIMIMIGFQVYLFKVFTKRHHVSENLKLSQGLDSSIEEPITMAATITQDIPGLLLGLGHLFECTEFQDEVQVTRSRPGQNSTRAYGYCTSLRLMLSSGFAINRGDHKVNLTVVCDQQIYLDPPSLSFWLHGALRSPSLRAPAGVGLPFGRNLVCLLGGETQQRIINPNY